MLTKFSHSERLHTSLLPGCIGLLCKACSGTSHPTFIIMVPAPPGNESFLGLTAIYQGDLQDCYRECNDILIPQMTFWPHGPIILFSGAVMCHLSCCTLQVIYGYLLIGSAAEGQTSKRWSHDRQLGEPATHARPLSWKVNGNPTSLVD